MRGLAQAEAGRWRRLLATSPTGCEQTPTRFFLARNPSGLKELLVATPSLALASSGFLGCVMRKEWMKLWERLPQLLSVHFVKFSLL
eukprot:2604103-Amphidinium_carterae.1